MESPIINIRDACIALFTAGATFTAGASLVEFTHPPLLVDVGLWTLFGVSALTSVGLIAVAVANVGEAWAKITKGESQ